MQQKMLELQNLQIEEATSEVQVNYENKKSQPDSNSDWDY